MRRRHAGALLTAVGRRRARPGRPGEGGAGAEAAVTLCAETDARQATEVTAGGSGETVQSRIKKSPGKGMGTLSSEAGERRQVKGGLWAKFGKEKSDKRSDTMGLRSSVRVREQQALALAETRAEDEQREMEIAYFE